MKIIGIIPARYASSRFPGKPLASVAGKPLIRRVIEQCQKSAVLAEVVVATDDPRIGAAVREDCRVEMTGDNHPSGTDRVAEVAARIPCDGVVNIQGDEPLIHPSVIDIVATGLSEAGMTTAAAAIAAPGDCENPNVTKVVVSRSGRALLFSRRFIPFLRAAAAEPLERQCRQFPFLKHIGIYGYRSEILQQLVRLPVSLLEKAEGLEQLRALENDLAIRVFQVDNESVGVDRPEDVAKVEAILASQAALPTGG